MNVLAFAASLSKQSSNQRLVDIIAARLRAGGAAVDLASFAEFDMPMFDPDLGEQGALPAGAQEFARRIHAADALVIAAPEYLHAPPALLKSALEWISRLKPVPVSGKVALLVSAASSPVGGARGLIMLRETLASMGMWIVPQGLGIGRAGQVLGEDGTIRDAKIDAELDQLLGQLLRVGAALARG
jgi:NAD(P)H-dependent FMN reductase